MVSLNQIKAALAFGPVLLVVLPGCGGIGRSKHSAPTMVQVEKEGGQKPSTPAEQAANFDQTYAEGLRLVKNGEYGLALGAFESACDSRPNSPEALFNLGACHEAIGDPLRAINYYRRVLDISPDDPDCYRNLGTSFIKLYYREKSPAWRKMAVDAWNRSLELKPDQPDVRSYLAQSEKID